MQKREFLNSKQLHYGTAEHVYSLITVLPLTLMDFLAASPKPPLANLIENKKKTLRSNNRSLSCLYCAIRIIITIIDLESNSPQLVLRCTLLLPAVMAESFGCSRGCPRCLSGGHMTPRVGWEGRGGSAAGGNNTAAGHLAPIKKREKKSEKH